MSGLPNIEPVTLMVLVFGAVFGRKALYPVYLYVIMEFLFFGLGTWNFMYLYIWAIPAVLAWMLRKMEHPLGWAVLSGGFGLLFGMLCMPVDMVIGGFSYALAKWVSGIPSTSPTASAIWSLRWCCLCRSGSSRRGFTDK